MKQNAPGAVNYPFATITAYGPDNKLATKLVVGVFKRAGQKHAHPLHRWITNVGDIRHDPAIAQELADEIAFRARDGQTLEEIAGHLGNLEVRFPVMGLRSRDIRYGPAPLEGFVFADSGLVWSRSPVFTAADSDRHLVSSVGAGVRLIAFFPLELSVVRALNRPARGWSFDLSFRPGF